MAKYGRLKKNILSKSIRDIKQEGLLFFIKKTYRFFLHKILGLFSKMIVRNLKKKPKDFFYFEGKKLEYLIHPYNLTWINERTIEIPIVLEYIKNSNPDKIIEAGAVLRHYTTAPWKVVDKFENGNNIINEDLVNFNPKEKYDLIISISTLEHVGFDDENNPVKIVNTMENMKKWLNKNGRMIVTMPIGYNKYMDNLVFSNKPYFNKIYFMKRINRKNKWIEASIDEAREARYNYPYNNANAVVICIWEKK
ncbi:MAG: hypothetical protein Q8N63_06525 [Nanoarchaeota archaeon]|nr:hypothetical protein [Nanoarchaeota archaeon]